MAITTRENMLRIYRHEEPDYLPLARDIQTVRTIGQGQLFTLTGNNWVGQTNEIDFFGQNWVFEKNANAYNPDATNYIIKDVSKWRDYVKIPNLDAIDWKAKFAAENIQLDKTNKAIIVRDPIGIWERAFSMIRIDDLLAGLLEEPDAMFDFFKEMADHKIKMHNYYFEQYKPDTGARSLSRIYSGSSTTRKPMGLCTSITVADTWCLSWMTSLKWEQPPGTPSISATIHLKSKKKKSP